CVFSDSISISVQCSTFLSTTTPTIHCAAAYGKTVEQVVRNAAAFNDAMRQQGIASCGKHFPGYTCAKSDAHFELPRIDRTREELDQNELAVFKQLIDRLDSMM